MKQKLTIAFIILSTLTFAQQKKGNDFLKFLGKVHPSHDYMSLISQPGIYSSKEIGKSYYIEWEDGVLYEMKFRTADKTKDMSYDVMAIRFMTLENLQKNFGNKQLPAGTGEFMGTLPFGLHLHDSMDDVMKKIGSFTPASQKDDPSLERISFGGLPGLTGLSVSLYFENKKLTEFKIWLQTDEEQNSYLNALKTINDIGALTLSELRLDRERISKKAGFNSFQSLAMGMVTLHNNDYKAGPISKEDMLKAKQQYNIDTIFYSNDSSVQRISFVFCLNSIKFKKDAYQSAYMGVAFVFDHCFLEKESKEYEFANPYYPIKHDNETYFVHEDDKHFNSYNEHPIFHLYLNEEKGILVFEMIEERENLYKGMWGKEWVKFIGLKEKDPALQTFITEYKKHFNLSEYTDRFGDKHLYLIYIGVDIKIRKKCIAEIYFSEGYLGELPYTSVGRTKFENDKIRFENRTLTTNYYDISGFYGPNIKPLPYKVPEFVYFNQSLHKETIAIQHYQCK